MFAWLDGYGTTHTDTLSQAVTLPAAGVAVGLPGAVMDPAGRAPGGRSAGAGYRPPRRPAESVWAERARQSLIAGHAAATWMTWRRTASGLPPLRVVWGRR